MITTRHIFCKYQFYNGISKIRSVFTSRFFHSESTSGSSRVKTPSNELYKHYLNLPLPPNKVFATYVWIDGSGINLRSKDRLLESVPCSLEAVPQWSFDGSSTGQAHTDNSDTILVPSAIYKDPSRPGKHVIILCETCYSDGSPTPTNHRAKCAQLLSNSAQQEPWFGIEQEYTMFEQDLWPLGWPKMRGYPNVKNKYSYCGVGAGNIVGRHIVESHGRACIYAGLDYGGSNAEVMKGSWEFQVGTSTGIKAADDLWMGRFLLNRIAEDFGVVISYHPKPMGKDQPGIGCHHNFSTKGMRDNGGLAIIEKACQKLQSKHKDHMINYGLGDGEENKKRLTGHFETASFDEFRWGVADRGASIRLQRSVAVKQCGFLEDRRPAGDCDPYRVCGKLIETCL